MYVKHSIQARLCNYRFSGKAVSIKCFECVFAALGILHAISMCHIVICGLSG
jgi:hypothetical protein